MLKSLAAGMSAFALPALAGAQASASATDASAKDSYQTMLESLPLIERDVFFGDPTRTAVTISPDGTHLAWLAPENDVLNVWVQPIGGEARAITSTTERPIRSYRWMPNSKQVVYTQDKGGDENFHVFAVDVATGDEKNLTPFDGARAQILASDRSRPDDLLVSVNDRNPALFDVWTIDTITGERSKIEENTDGWVGYIADDDFNIRLGVKMTPDGGQEVWHRPVDGTEWSQILRWDSVDAGVSNVLGFDRSGNTLYVTDSRERNTAALLKLDMTNGVAGELEVVAAHPKADFSGAISNPETGTPQAVAFDYARTEWSILDSSFAKDWEKLRMAESGEIGITSRDLADSKWVVAYSHDDASTTYHLYDRDAGSTTRLFTARPELDGLSLAKMEPHIISSRDGLELVSYLTTPPNWKTMADKPTLPMVLLVHGGPWARDSWGFNPMHQWLANRGYAVLSVNFRGSTGFGKSFMNAGNREWAGKMHDDLLDAVDWAIDRGITSREKVGIMGGSYGGYATLVGLTFTPDVFACGVDIVGPSNLTTLLSSIPPYWAPMIAFFEERMGSLDNPEALDAMSPITKVDAITKPLLIGQGANDPRVKEAESEQIVSAMQERDLPVTYVLFPDEGHGFARKENRMAFWAITEAFLSEHLGGRRQPISGEVDRSTADIRSGRSLIPGL